MNTANILSIGGSRNIGYLSSIRLLESGATVTFLLRNPATFDADAIVQKYVQTGKARLVKGDALVRDDVQRAWDAAGPVDAVVFTVGNVPSFSLTKGAVQDPPDLVTHSFLNVLSTLPSPPPKLIACSSTGLTKESHAALPLAWKPIYGWLLAQPHRDKCGLERIAAHVAGREWTDTEPGDEIMGAGWRARQDLPAPGTLSNILIVRPAFLTDGQCKADAGKGKGYRVKEWDMESAYTISRKDVAHFIVEGALKHWSDYGGKVVSVAY
ncbi:hypothetical protein PLICRDRAFT_101613 [Plicaturopsis crispa FD-325 SS-3]|nr:hypothetical protein PLICRDRAFT_101613 [Plicaturopsis crispa FD-325 SS-3]